MPFKFRDFNDIKDAPAGRTRSRSSSTPRSDPIKSTAPKNGHGTQPKPMTEQDPTHQLLQPTPSTSKETGTTNNDKSKRKRKHDERDKPIHPYILKFNAYERKLQKLLGRMFDIANNDLLISNRDSGINDFDMNYQFADRLEQTSKLMVDMSKNCSQKAKLIREKVENAQDTKLHSQDAYYVGTVLKPSEFCDELRSRTKPPKQWIRDEATIVKHETRTIYISSDESDIDNYPGDIDTKFKYPKTNNNKEKEQFKCDVCNKNFRDSIELRNHRSNHDLEIYRCLRCFSYCRSLRTYEDHVKTHTGEMYPCEHENCDSWFTKRSSLTNHMQKHMGQHLTCDICNKKFTYKQNFYEHRKFRHLPNPSVPCPICKKYYWTPTSMRTHRAQLHGLVSELYREG